MMIDANSGVPIIYPAMMWGETLRPLDVKVWDPNQKQFLSFQSAAVSVYLNDELVLEDMPGLVTPDDTNPLWPALWWDGTMGIQNPEELTTYDVYWHLTRNNRTLTLPDPFKWIVKPKR